MKINLFDNKQPLNQQEKTVTNTGETSQKNGLFSANIFNNQNTEISNNTQSSNPESNKNIFTNSIFANQQQQQ